VSRPPATLFLTCGLPGSGKTTLARRLEREHSALRLTADEWLCDLHPELPEADRDAIRDRVERLQWSTALRALTLGVNVVLDWGLWSREERDRYRTQARAVGARVVLCLLEASRQELLDRLRSRNAAAPPGIFRVTEEEFERAWRFFQRDRPTLEELGRFDPVPDPEEPCPRNALSDEELTEIDELAEAATPGPWHVRQLDDDWAMCLVAVSTVPDTGRGERWPAFDHRELVAATLVQHPRYVDAADERWDENAAFIASARADVPRLVAEVRRLRGLLARQERPRSSPGG
jgi:predicted kinase